VKHDCKVLIMADAGLLRMTKTHWADDRQRRAATVDGIARQSRVIKSLAARGGCTEISLLIKPEHSRLPLLTPPNCMSGPPWRLP
jgi:hypothetical protein